MLTYFRYVYAILTPLLQIHSEWISLQPYGMRNFTVTLDTSIGLDTEVIINYAARNLSVNATLTSPEGRSFRPEPQTAEDGAQRIIRIYIPGKATVRMQLVMDWQSNSFNNYLLFSAF